MNPGQFPDQATNVASPRKPGDSHWYIILSALAAVATIVSLFILVFPSLPFGKATPKPSPTPVSLTYAAHIPGPGCDSNQASVWNLLNATVDCTTTGLAVNASINPSVSRRLNAEVTFRWQNHPFPQDYTAQVTIAPHATSDKEPICGGLDVLGSTAGSYILLVCSNSSWLVARYDENGTASIIARGQLAHNPSYRVEVHVTGQAILSTVDGNVVNQATRDPTYAQTSFLELVTAQPNTIPAIDRTVTAYFLDFRYSYQPGP